MKIIVSSLACPLLQVIIATFSRCNKNFVMECFKMYTVVVNLLIVAIKVSEAVDDIRFEKQEPKIVLIGDNVTFYWLYTGEQEVTIIRLFVAEDSGDERMVYYPISLNGSEPQFFQNVVEKYATSVTWDGNVLKKKYAFTLVNVSQSSHEKTFSLQLDYKDFTKETYPTKDPLFISVSPKVELRIDKTNVSVGDRVTIECHLIKPGRPRATILWYHNDTLVKEKAGRFLFREDEVEKKDAGSYRCIGKNNAGEDRSEVITITVRGKQNRKGFYTESPRARGRSSGLGGGDIAGLVIGILFLVIFIIVIVFILKKRKGKPKSNERSTVNDDESKSAMVPTPEEKDQVWL